MMGNTDIYEAVRKVPENACRPINGGRMNGKTDINPMWRIKTLTEQFGPCGIGWYFNVTDKRMEPCGEEMAVFVDIELFVRYEGEWSKPIYGTGGNMFAKKEYNGLYVSDECFKMATTDALSVACKHLGIGADVYWSSDGSKYSTANAEGKPSSKPSYDPRIKEILQELDRTGYSVKSCLQKYKVSSLEQMSDLQIRDFLGKIRKVADKAG